MKRTPLQRKTRLQAKRRDSLKRRTRMRQVSKKRKSRVGKLGIVRLVGADLANLRLMCFNRDDWRCVDCGASISWDGCYPFEFPKGEMAHIRTKRNNGDVLSNVKTLCPTCHQKSHNCNGKPCPRKPEVGA